MSLRIILVETKHSGNLGSTARAMKNFGLSDLVLVRPRCAVDRQAYAMASHAGDVLAGARTVEDTRDAVTGCTFVLGTTARERAAPGTEVVDPRSGVDRLRSRGGAVMFGPEDFGLSNSDLDMCQAAVRIPTSAYASLNLAQAVNVMAYEWFMRGLEPAPAEPPSSAEAAPAPREEQEGMIGHLMEVLLHIGYTEGAKATSVEHMFRRIFDRAALTSREVAALRGLWAQTKWAADAQPERVPGNREEA